MTDELKNDVPFEKPDLQEQTRAEQVYGKLLSGHITGFWPSVTAAPTDVPKSFLDQIRIYDNGSTHALYWYSTATSSWWYVSKTGP